MDLAAAARLQDLRHKLRAGPWNTGELGSKGFVVTEPLGAADQGASDNIRRYTDRYLRRKTIGRTVDNYAFTPAFLPPELHRPVGLKKPATAAGGVKSSADLAEARLATVVSAVSNEATEDVDKADDNNDENDHDQDRDAEDDEDEFEEMDDDDYNAEKYFDDGDDEEPEDGDGDGEAAY